MAEPKRGRPAIPSDQKRQQIGVRVAPEVKAQLEAVAAANGRSVAQEIELRLVQSLERVVRNAETEALFNDMARDIAAIQEQTRKAWHRDLKTWGAVAEAMAKGAIVRHKPDRWQEDSIISEKWEAVCAIRSKREPLLAKLQAHGVSVQPEILGPRPRGLFGRSGNNALLMAAFKDEAGDFANRFIEWRQIMAHEDITEEQRADLLQTLREILALDEDEAKAREEHSAELRLYIQDEVAGREIFKAMMKRRQEEAWATGDIAEAMRLMEQS